MSRNLRVSLLCCLLTVVALPPLAARDALSSLLPGSLYQRLSTAGTRSATAQWTILVYLDGDNDLEEDGIIDLNEMEAVGSTADVNVVVQFDRAAGYDTSNGNWTTCRRYYVTQDSNASTIGSTMLEDLGEVNMGDPATLSAFISWGMSNYPATNYALVLWDHGGGWRSPSKLAGKALTRAPRRPDGKAVCWDGADCLYTKEWAGVLAATPNVIPLVAFDTCLAGMIEPTYEARVTGRASVMVASAATVPLDGYPYDTILTALTATPTMTPLALGDKIVECYEDYYSDQTIGCYDLTQIPTVLSSVNSFVTAATSGGVWPIITDARSAAEDYDGYKDLPGFIAGVRDAAPAGSVRTAATNACNALTAMIHSYYAGTAYSDGRGIAVSFPDTGPEAEYTNSNIAWVGASSWDEFLVAFASADKIAPSAPVLNAIDNADGDDGYTLSWAAATDNSGIAGYYVEEYAAPTTLFTDNAEAASPAWSLSGFSRNTAQAHGGTCAYYSGQGNNLTSRMTFSSSLTLTGTRPLLDFWTWYDTEQDYDYGRVYISNNGGSTYERLASFCGTSGGWIHLQYDLSAYAGQSIRLRFAYETDDSVAYTGVYLDDITIIDSPLTGSNWSVPGNQLTLAVTNRPRGTWGYCVRATDNSGNVGDFSDMRTATVTNAGPTEPTSVTISPAAPTSDEAITATASGSVEGAASKTITYSYQWCKRTSPTGSWTGWNYSGQTMGAHLTKRDEEWKARARAVSGTATSDWVESEAVTILNAPPRTATSVTVTPKPAYCDDSLTAKASGYDDPDGDAITCQYEWCRSTDNGQTWSGWDWSGRTISADETERDQRWQVRMRARDASGPGEWKTSAVVVIRNTPPTVPTALAIKPAAPDSDDNLTGAASGSSDLDGDGISYVYQWSRSTDGGDTWGKWAYSGKVLNATQTAPGQRWKVRARATDGSASGPWLVSAPVLIRRPAAPALALTAASAALPGRTAVQVTCLLTQEAAVSGRLLNLAGRLVAELTPRTLPAGSSTVTWQVRGPGGAARPAGTYLLQLQAQGESGQTALVRGTVTLTP